MTIPIAKAPRYDAYRPSSASASRAKRRNKAKDSMAEVLLRKALWARGARYQLHAKSLPGKPDLVFLKKRVAVFVDGDFWHGRNWEELEKKLKKRANPDYWIAKIAYNRARDIEQTEALKEQGWTVLRFWETAVTKDPDVAVEKILNTLAFANQS